MNAAQDRESGSDNIVELPDGLWLKRTFEHKGRVFHFVDQEFKAERRVHGGTVHMTIVYRSEEGDVTWQGPPL